jgi:hypothetical protein
MNRIKSIIQISIASVLAIVAISLTSCRTVATSAIELAVEEANAECPMYVDEDTTCDRIYTNGNNIIYDYSTTSEVIDGLRSLGQEYCKSLHYEELATSTLYDSDIQTLIDLCIEAHYNIVYKYRDEYGNTYVVTVTYQDLATI